MTREESLRAVGVICKALDEKLAKDVQVIDISEISTLGDYFVIASGSNDHQVDALVENVDMRMHNAGYDVTHTEGFHRGGWVLMDYNDIVVHIFDEESRAFYNIERIWKDGKAVDPQTLN